MGGRTGRTRFLVAAAVIGFFTAAVHADVVCTYTRPFDSRIPASAPATKGWMDDAIIDVPSHLIITDLDVSIDLTHTKAFDLQLYLQSPSGSRILLNAYDPFTQYFNGQDYRATTFDDEAATPIDKGSPPFTGSYRPLDPLSTFDGQDAYGRWRLSVYDAYYVNTGRFREFTLTITVPEPVTAAFLLLGLPLLGWALPRHARAGGPPVPA
jgi:subtilisin-like proprotein convertase family protein